MHTMQDCPSDFFRLGQDIPSLELQMVRLRLDAHALSDGCFVSKAAKGCHAESVGRENQ